MTTPYHAIAFPASLGTGEWTILIKDSIDVAGIPTRQGSAVLADAPPAPAHAEVVERLLADARWTITGKANMHEFAFGVTGVNPWAGTPVNPLWPDRIPGGSSSGSAVAVAAGIVDAALGTDTGGSVRMPAACCGVVGFKPSFGLVSRRGVHPAQSTLDCVGVFARSVAMVDKVMKAIAPDWSIQPTPETIRAAWIEPACSPAVADAVQVAARSSGVDLIPATLPLLDEAFTAGIAIIGSECWTALGHHADHPAMGEDVRARIKAGALHTSQDLADAETVRTNFADAVDALLDDHDVLMLPTLPAPPPTLVEAVDARACVPLTRFVRPFNLSGHPAITLPLHTAEGLPAGLQLIGRRGEDARLCAIARLIEQRLTAFQRAAPIPS